jgi:hypothetical protein
VTTYSLLAALSYACLGLAFGILAAWEVVLTWRPRRVAPAIDIALGAVAIVVAVAWPAWVIGWGLYSRQYEPREPRMASAVRVVLGAAVLVAIVLIMSWREFG